MDNNRLYTLVIAGLIFMGGVIILLLVKKDFKDSRKWSEKTKKRLDNSRLAKARIISIYHQRNGRREKELVHLNVWVYDEHSQPYAASTKWIVEVTHFKELVEGSTISIRIDMNNPVLIYPGEDWAVYAVG